MQRIICDPACYCDNERIFVGLGYMAVFYNKFIFINFVFWDRWIDSEALGSCVECYCCSKIVCRINRDKLNINNSTKSWKPGGDITCN